MFYLMNVSKLPNGLSRLLRSTIFALCCLFNYNASFAHDAAPEHMVESASDFSISNLGESLKAAFPAAIFTVTNTNDAGTGSLRDCINNANIIAGVDTIVFSIPNSDANYVLDTGTGNETWTISPVTDFPEITEGVILDATTQPGTGNYKIKINGQGTRNRGLSVSGGFIEVYGFYLTGFAANSGSAAIHILNLFGSPCTIGAVNKGNVINASSTGIFIALVNDCIIKGNLIGTDEKGQVAMGNTVNGISLSGGNASRTVIGGLLPGERNLISGNNRGIGTNVSGNNIIQGNYIGTNLDGTLAIPNTIGILFGTNSNNQVLDNLISGNSGAAIQLINTSGNTIRANIIGEAINGAALGNNIGIDAAVGGLPVTKNIVGGLGANEGNIIANNTNQAVFINRPGSINNSIIGNSIYCNGSGIDLDGVANNNIQPPAITSVTLTSVSGTGVDGDAIHVYKDNSGCKPLQGEEYLGMTTVTGGTWTVGSLALAADDEITATATNSTDGTSEFWKAPFITTWKTDNFGTSSDTEILIPLEPNTTYDFTVAWGDGTSDTFTGLGSALNPLHDYGTSGTYTVSISGAFTHIYFNNGGDRQKILTIEQWGDIAWTSMNDAFEGCSNLTYNATDNPILTDVTQMFETFKEATSFNGDISGWNVSNVVTMGNMFQGATSFNQSLSNWERNTPGNVSTVGNVVNMILMFDGASAFNGDVSSWNTGSVTVMAFMFRDAVAFNQDLGAWDITSVTSMSDMLDNTALSITNYDNTLVGWSTQTTLPNVDVGALGLQYCSSGEAARTVLQADGWVFSGDALSTTCGPEIDVYAGAENSAALITNAQTTPISFGITAVGAAISQDFLVENNGNEDLVIASITVSEGLFSLSSGATLTIPPSASELITIEFNASAVGAFNATVTINSNDLDEESFVINVTGEVTQPVSINIFDPVTNAVIIAGQAVNVGTTTINVEKEKSFEIRNISTTDILTITNITVDNAAFQIIDAPTAISPSSRETFVVRLLSSIPGQYRANITISTSINDFTFAVTGEVLSSENPPLIIYNVVTPNGDNKHDFFKIVNIEAYASNTVTVYNRWGRRVFERAGYNNASNFFIGLSEDGEELLTGNYYYVIDKGNGDKAERGFIFLKR